FASLPVIGGALRPWLRLPALPVPGSPQSLRVATPSYGALIRMDVSPAHPEEGILEMSAGESGHFLSPNFADQQADWLAGAPAPGIFVSPRSRWASTPALRRTATRNATRFSGSRTRTRRSCPTARRSTSA